MKDYPVITQENFRILLPGKVSRAICRIMKARHCAPLTALMEFYQSPTYRYLDREETKYWWMSDLQLYEAFCEESENADDKNIPLTE